MPKPDKAQAALEFRSMRKHMCPYDNEIEKIKNQIVNRYNPLDIILFGSCARGRVAKSSDIDFCIVMETEDKRSMVQDILLNVNYDVDLDIVIYSPEEWLKLKGNLSTLAGIINKTGVSLIGGQQRV